MHRWDGTPTMTWRYTQLADIMNSTGTLLKACRDNMADPRLCMFSENSLAYTKTPVFAINSVINFFSMEKLRPYFNSSKPYPPDWVACDKSGSTLLCGPENASRAGASCTCTFQLTPAHVAAPQPTGPWTGPSATQPSARLSTSFASTFSRSGQGRGPLTGDAWAV